METFVDSERRSSGTEKSEFVEVRWMKIGSHLKRASDNGKKPVKRIEFKGERLDMSSVRRQRDKALSRVLRN